MAVSQSSYSFQPMAGFCTSRGHTPSHRKDKRLVGISLLISVPFSQIQRGQRGVEMKVKLLFAAGLTIGQPGKLLGLPKNKVIAQCVSLLASALIMHSQ